MESLGGDDGYDTETMQKIDTEIKKQVEDMKKVCFR